MQLEILYEDNHCIAVYKSAGVLVQGDETGDESLLDAVRAFLKERGGKPGSAFVGLVHRLDRPASGIVLFAKTSKGAARLSAQFRERTVRKTYHVLVEGHLVPPAGELVHRLAKDDTRRVAVVSPDGDEARLAYETVAAGPRSSLVRVALETGRFHQIRAQLAAAGCPVVGDVKYGAVASLPDRAVALCATELSFTTATTNEMVTLTVPYPASWDALLQE